MMQVTFLVPIKGWGYYYYYYLFVFFNSLRHNHQYKICETIKQHESELENIIYLVFYLMLFSFQRATFCKKNPLKLDMSFQSYDLLKGHQNNRKQKDLFPLFGSISKLIFASSDSFCLLTPHILPID